MMKWRASVAEALPENKGYEVQTLTNGYDVGICERTYRRRCIA